jgi:hypothetical protein
MIACLFAVDIVQQRMKHQAVECLLFNYTYRRLSLHRHVLMSSAIVTTAQTEGHWPLLLESLASHVGSKISRRRVVSGWLL